MNRTLGAALLVLAVTVPVAACGADDDDSASYASSSGGGDSCNAYSTCGACTPVDGCGWCFNSASGLCTSDPDNCANVTEFTWTWDPSGCPDFDASVVPLDAGKSTPVPEAGATETSAPEASAPETSTTDTGVAPITDASPVESGH